MSTIGKRVGASLAQAVSLLARLRAPEAEYADDPASLLSSSPRTQQLHIEELVRDALTQVVREAEPTRWSFDARMLRLDSAGRHASPNYVAFLRVDDYVPDLMDRTKGIEAHVTQQMRKRFGVEVTQVYWRWGEKAQPPGLPLQQPRGYTDPMARWQLREIPSELSCK